MTIRFAEKKDAAAIAEIHNHYVTNTLITFDTEARSVEAFEGEIAYLTDSGYPYLVYEDALEGVIGFVHAHPWCYRTGSGRTLEISIYVKDGLTGRGIGTQLMNEIIRICRDQQTKSLIFCSVEGNRSHVLAERAGFVNVGTCREVGRKFDRWLDVTDWQLML